MTWLLTLAGLAGWGMRVTAPVGGASLQVASGLNLSPSVNLGVVVDTRSIARCFAILAIAMMAA
jgi:hypothetical protein